MAIDSVRYVGAPSEYVANVVSQDPLWRSFGERIGVMARVMCPVGKIPAGQDAGKPHQNTHLRDTMEVRFVSGDTPMILVGSVMTRGPKDYSALGMVIEGTDPHPIDPADATEQRPNPMLRWFVNGQPVFAKHVNHPGTKPNDFVTRSMRLIALEAS